MILRNEQKISKVVDKGETNQQKKHIYLEVGNDPKESFLYATNGRILVKLPIDGTGDSSGFLSRKSVEACEKQKIFKAIGATPGHAQVVNGPMFTRPDVTKQINYEQDLNFPEAKMTIALDVDLLARLAKAFGTSKLVLAINDPLKGIKVTPLVGDGVGAIMGLKI